MNVEIFTAPFIGGVIGLITNKPKIMPKSSTIFLSLIQKQLLAKIIQPE